MENEKIKIFLFTILLFLFTFIGIQVSKLGGNIILIGKGGMGYSELIYNPLFQILGMTIIIISKKTFDNGVVLINSLLERK